jgi:hypothetical protein
VRVDINAMQQPTSRTYQPLPNHYFGTYIISALHDFQSCVAVHMLFLEFTLKTDCDELLVRFIKLDELIWKKQFADVDYSEFIDN